ncbi:Exosome component 5 [Borealophlyctis nickersoniae]|nr:Exosome component 5 [Borealophlyctis nickersoniae]
MTATNRLRPDKRELTVIRNMSCSFGLLNRADGSARFGFAVYGPAEVKIRDEKLDKATVEVSFTPVSGTSTTQDRLYERIIRESLETSILAALHPRTSIRITCQAVSDDGSILSAAMNAAVLALIDAGIPLQSLIGSTTCMIDDQGDVLLDPTALELQNARSVHMFAFDNVSSGIIACESVGLYTASEYEDCYAYGEGGAKYVHAFMTTAITRKVAKETGVKVGKVPKS